MYQKLSREVLELFSVLGVELYNGYNGGFQRWREGISVKFECDAPCFFAKTDRRPDGSGMIWREWVGSKSTLIIRIHTYIGWFGNPFWAMWYMWESLLLIRWKVIRLWSFGAACECFFSSTELTGPLYRNGSERWLLFCGTAWDPLFKWTTTPSIFITEP